VTAAAGRPATDDSPAVIGPPAVIGLLAHPLRWRLLRELTASDRAVRELTERLDESQNLVSYHLRRLREGGLVTSHRSSADGRDSYYAIDLVGCERQLEEAAGALHPALWSPLGSDSRPGPPRAERRVLFLCTGNSARSQMAEAIVNHHPDHAVTAASAGSHPKPLHANAVRAMRHRGIDIAHQRSKHVDELASQPFDVVVTLCDRVREVCPELPSHPDRVHWSIPDPSQAGASDRASYPAFERTAAELETRIRFLLPVLAGRQTPLHEEVN
jgi:protein-tyrosine-phosphatase/DNA-binding transcriptional ArsR family regulator